MKGAPEQPAKAPSGEHLTALHLFGLGLLAVALRTCNLGGFSMWVDEILTLLRAQRNLVATWDTCMANLEHPPLPVLIMALGKNLGFNETLQRAIPIILGTATVVIVAAWVSAILGRRAGALAGLLSAVSPFHIRYSQDLNGYSYLAFFVVLSCYAFTLLADRLRPRRAVLLAVALCGGLYSNHFFPLLALPLAIYWLEVFVISGRVKRGSMVLLFMGSAGAALLMFAPWLPALFRLSALPPRGGVVPCTWSYLADRWQFLTVAGREPAQLGWGGVLILVVAGIGAVCAMKQRYGRLILLSFLTGTLGVEILLRVKSHWSDGRYSTIGWVFLVVLAAIGIDKVMTFGRRPFMGYGLLVAVAAAHLQGIVELQRTGRPSWDRMSEVVRMVRRPGEKVFTSIGHAQVPIAYYLLGPDYREQRSNPEAPIPLHGDLGRLVELWTEDRSCLLVIGQPKTPEILRVARHFPEIVRYYSTGHLFRLTPEIRDRLKRQGLYPRAIDQDRTPSGWPEPALDLVPGRLRRVHRTCLGDLAACVRGEQPWYTQTARLEFDEKTSAGLLLHGWSGFEHDGQRMSFVWVDGREASVRLFLESAGPYQLSIRLRPYSTPGRNQRLRGLLNGHVLGGTTLTRGYQTVSVTIPSELVRPGENLLTLQLAYAAAPKSSGKGRWLSAAFDWIEVTERE